MRKLKENLIVKLDDALRRGEERGGGWGVLLMMAYTGRLFQASVNSDIRGLLVEVYEKVGIPVIVVCERAQKG